MQDPRSGSNLAVGVALGVAALALTVLAGALWLAESEDGLPVAELTRVESLDDAGEHPLEDHMRWSFEVFGGERAITEADLRTRFAPSFAAGATAEDLNGFVAVVHETYGPLRFVRFTEFERDFGLARALGVGENGVPLLATISIADDGAIGSWSLDEDASEPRLPGWQAALLLAGGWLFVAVGLGARRTGGTSQAWIAMAAGVLTLSSGLILASSSPAYTVGRVAPAFALVLAVWLLVERPSERGARVALVGAGLAAGLGTVAPFTRNATLIGHPSVFGLLADSAAIYRVLLGGSSLLTGGALAFVGVTMVRQLGAESRWRRPPQWAALGVATVWALAAAGSALDYGTGDGALAGGGLHALALITLAAVPVVVGFRLVAERWDRPELAGLVIELGSGGGELGPAVARALEDESVQVLVSGDGVRLVDEQGRPAAIDDLAPGRALTQIRSGGRLVGGLLHDTTLRGQPERLRAVAAALGPALEVTRLKGEVEAQLIDVRASRRRIIETSDDARRRIERDLHDGAQQRLVALGIELQRGRRLADAAGSPELATLLDAATADVRGAIEDIRSASRGTHPALLTERGLVAAVDALAERSPVPVRTEIDETLPPETALVAYYVVAEGLANVAKHAADATRASVAVRRRDGAVQIEVSDDGGGGATVVAGSGLQGLDDRVAAAGGRFGIRSDESGTTLTAVIPCA